MSLSTRQKIYAVAVKSKFKRGTWNGCVMNQVANVTHSQAAADYLHEPVGLISRFIAAWDQTSGHIVDDAHATRILIEALMAAGLVEKTVAEPEKYRVWRVRVYTSVETEMVEALRAEIEDGAFDSILSEMEELCLV